MLVGFPDFRLLRIPGSARLKIFRENSTFKKILRSYSGPIFEITSS
jgi:hypothetical protein